MTAKIRPLGFELASDHVSLVTDATQALQAAGMNVSALRTTAAFCTARCSPRHPVCGRRPHRRSHPDRRGWPALRGGQCHDPRRNPCPRQDAGFSPLTFAWSARALPIRRIAAAQGWSDTEIDALEQFRDDLIGHVLAESQPDNRCERAVPFFSNSAVQPCIAVRIRSDRCEIRTDIGQNSIFAAPKPT